MYATGGSEQSTVLIGLPIGKTKIVIYTISGFCASLSGLVFNFYMLLEYGLHANGSMSLEVMLKKIQSRNNNKSCHDGSISWIYE